MFNIPAAATPGFSEVQNTGLNYTEWEFSPETYVEVPSFVNQPTPDPLAVNTKIKNYIAALGTGTYDTFYVKVELEILGAPFVANWVTMSGPLPDAAGEGYELTPNNLNVETTYIFQNLNQLIPDSYLARIDHIVKGEKPNGDIDIIYTYPYYIRLQRLGYNDVLLTPNKIEQTHFIGNNLPAGEELEIYANGDFILTASHNLQVTGGNLQTYTPPIAQANFAYYQGTGSQTITATLKAAVESLGQSNPYHEFLIGISNSNGGEDVTRFLLYQYETADFSVLPEAFNFHAIKGFQEAGSEFLFVTGYGAFTMQHPSWLTVSPNSGTHQQNAVVEPVPSGNLSVGVYTGFIVINAPSETIKIPVSYTVVDQFDIGFKPNAVNFTRDPEISATVYGEDFYKLQVELSTLVYKYDGVATTTKSLVLSRGLFNQKTQFTLPKFIHTYMEELFSLDLVGDPNLSVLAAAPGAQTFQHKIIGYYNPSLSSVTLTFLSVATGLPIGITKQFSNTDFIKGRKPDRFFQTPQNAFGRQDFGIVNAKNNELRVTRNSWAMFNFYQRSNTSVIKVYRNGVFYKNLVSKRENHYLRGIRFNFLAFEQGDVIDLQLHKQSFIGSTEPPVENQDYFKQRYIVFPENKFSYHIAWENEHGLIELYEFTGGYAINNKFESFAEPVYNEFVEEVRKYGTKREVQVTCRTGWTLKSNAETMQDLARSKRAWIVFENKDAVSLVPTDHDVVSEDATQGKYSFEVKFRLNAKDGLENITF
ncbi:MAG: hypothetical protein CMM93_08640 [Rickettsiales bacterium]|nr:hypothetical protein [Rickettsiales bacterium]